MKSRLPEVAGLAFLLLMPVPRAACQVSRALVVHVAEATTGIFVPDAEVTLVEMGVSQRTDIVGEATFSHVSPGRCTIRVRRVGYEPLLTIVQIGDRDTLHVTMLIVRAPKTLDTVRTLASAVPAYLGDFEARRKEGLGYFATAADLVPYWDGNLGTAIAVARHLPVQYGGRHGDGGRQSCLFVDGVRYSGDDSAIHVSEIAGIEVYTIAPPVEFSGGGCVGVVVVWLKRGGS